MHSGDWLRILCYSFHLYLACKGQMTFKTNLSTFICLWYIQADVALLDLRFEEQAG